MTKRANAKYKIDRRMGENIWGRPKSPVNKREYGPGQHGQRRKGKMSDFGTQLKAKQKLKGYYGNISERQFRKYYAEAIRMKGDSGANMIGLLECRLDAIVFRAKFVPTVFAARQFVNHGHIKVNGRRVNIPSYRVKVGDVIDVLIERAEDREGQQRDEADSQVNAIDDFRRDGAQGELLIDDIQHEMHHGVGERGQADHTPDLQQRGPVQHSAERGNRQRNQEEADRPIAGGMDGLGHRAAAEVARDPIAGAPQAGQERRDQNRRLQREKLAAPVAPGKLHLKNSVSPRAPRHSRCGAQRVGWRAARAGYDSDPRTVPMLHSDAAGIGVSFWFCARRHTNPGRVYPDTFGVRVYIGSPI